MTSLGICYLVAEYYVAHREWPLSKAQLELQERQLLKTLKAQVSREEAQALSGVLGRFTLLDFRKSGENLVLHYRFKIERRTFDQTVTLTPRPSTDEILESMIGKGYE